MSFLLSDAKTYLRDRDRDDNSSRGARIYTRIANDALNALHQLGKFDWMRRFGDLIFNAAYNTGTVSINAGATAVTGVGTTFTAAMTGRYIRFQGETLQYLFTYVGATSGTISPAYAGTSNLAGVAFEITEDRVALPTRFRDYAWPSTDSVVVPRMIPKPLEELRAMRKLLRVTTFPWYYATEWVDVSTPAVPTPYMWVWPAVQNKRVITLPYYTWPAELTLDAEAFGLPNASAEAVLREFLKAYLYLEQEQADKFSAQLGVAEKMGREALANFRAQDEQTQREIWTPEKDKDPWRPLQQVFPGFVAGETFQA